MKEYIPKEYLQDYANAHGEVVDWAESEVLTKADICREFLNKLAVKYPKSLPELWEAVDSLLAEMEQGE